jgi:hypothetical protein
MSEIPVLHVAESPVERLARRANRTLFTDVGERPAPISFKVAQH